MPSHQPFGRWNRAHSAQHRIEIISDPPAVYAECMTCNWQGSIGTSEQAQAEAEQHERDVWEVTRAGKRMIRGRIE